MYVYIHIKKLQERNLCAMQAIWQSISQTVISAFPLVNLLVVIVAGCLGSLLSERIRSPLREILLRSLGLVAILMGAVEAWNGFFVLQTAQFETTGTVLVIFSLIVGYAFGYALNLDRSIGQAGVWLHNQFIKDKPSRSEIIALAKGEEAPRRRKVSNPSAEGFLLATILCALSSTTVYSTLVYSTSEDPLPLLLRLGFHALTFFLLAALFGSGVNFAAVSVIVVEGILLIVSALCGDLITHNLLNQLRLIGAVVLVAAGLSMGGGRRVRAPRLVPAYLIPVIYGLSILLVTRAMETA